jgi:hypothetical protein
MSVDRADLSGDVKPRDRFLHRIEDALLNVVLRPRLECYSRSAKLRRRRRADSQLASSFLADVCDRCLARFTKLAPTFDDSVQHF